MPVKYFAFLTAVSLIGTVKCGNSFTREQAEKIDEMIDSHVRNFRSSIQEATNQCDFGMFWHEGKCEDCEKFCTDSQVCKSVCPDYNVYLKVMAQLDMKHREEKLQRVDSADFKILLAAIALFLASISLLAVMCMVVKRRNAKKSDSKSPGQSNSTFSISSLPRDQEANPSLGNLNPEQRGPACVRNQSDDVVSTLYSPSVGRTF